LLAGGKHRLVGHQLVEIISPQTSKREQSLVLKSFSQQFRELARVIRGRDQAPGIEFLHLVYVQQDPFDLGVFVCKNLLLCGLDQVNQLVF
jgi:hypothetical protein